MAFYHCTIFGQYACGANFPLLETGGEKEHTLTIEEMPRHTPVVWYIRGNGSSGSSAYTEGLRQIQSWHHTEATGGDTPHNNMPPYIVQIVHVKS